MSSKQTLLGTFRATDACQARKEFRSGNHFMTETSGLCSGFSQVNIVIVPHSFAKDFAGFCHANSGPMPLLFQSEPGQFTAPPLGEDLDVRTDLGGYDVFENGKKSEVVGDLLKFNDQMKEHVSFYLGCSFSFEKEYLDAGLPLRAAQQNRNTPLYLTNVKCMPYGMFKTCRQFVSMRPIPKHQLELVTNVTLPMVKYHGAPMHIGDPGMIGIDLNNHDMGDVLDLEEGDVPVFWSCGATGIPAIKNCGANLGFTQAQSCMLITDIPTEKDDLGDNASVAVIKVQEVPFFASIISHAKLQEINRFLKDSAITRMDEVLKCAIWLSHSSSVAIVTDQLDNKNINGVLTLVQVTLALKMKVKVLLHTATNDNLINDVKKRLEIQDGVMEKVKVEQIPKMIGEGTTESAERDAEMIDYVIMHMPKTEVDISDFMEQVKQTSERVKITAVTENDVNTKCTADFNIDLASGCGCQLLASLLVILRSCPIHERYQRRNIGYPQSSQLTESLQEIVAVK
ncbi:putative hydro-lyase PST_2764 [Anneissia japonica]|uniref:putative hydro-lyase PST_2764 n=1 Tax=Anneissia japonica TaxID=1529436 RepID=UPI001425AA7F|nr:putative hydro-lyase PST_2764 [Anneissia japonica]